jgi:hypothetical protein
VGEESWGQVRDSTLTTNLANCDVLEADGDSAKILPKTDVEPEFAKRECTEAHRRHSSAYSEIATNASTMIGTLSGEGPWPGAERAWRPASPQISTIRSLKPFKTLALS